MGIAAHGAARRDPRYGSFFFDVFAPFAPSCSPHSLNILCLLFFSAVHLGLRIMRQSSSVALHTSRFFSFFFDVFAQSSVPSHSVCYFLLFCSLLCSLSTRVLSPLFIYIFSEAHFWLQFTDRQNALYSMIRYVYDFLGSPSPFCTVILLPFYFSSSFRISTHEVANTRCTLWFCFV